MHALIAHLTENRRIQQQLLSPLRATAIRDTLSGRVLRLHQVNNVLNRFTHLSLLLRNVFATFSRFRFTLQVPHDKQFLHLHI